MKNIRYILFFAVIAVLAMATLVHRLYGSSVAVDLIYHSWWFISLWGVVAACSVYAFVRYGKSSVSGWLLHASIILLLSGALLTFFTGEKGTLHIRTGAGSVYFLDDHSSDCFSLPFELRLDRFSVVSNPITYHPTDYVSRVTIRDQQQQIGEIVAVNHPLSYRGYRFLQGSYDEDLQGVTLMVNHDPWGRSLVYAAYLLFLAGGVWPLISRRRWRDSYRLLHESSRRMLKGIFVVAVLLIPLVGMVSMQLNRDSMPPVLLSGWLKPHVWSVTAAYALFFSLVIIALFAEVWQRRGATDQVERLTVMSKMILYPAILLLAIGIGLGSVWASESWGAYWSWDPKEVWALITLLLYALPAHHETIPWMQHPIRFHRYLFFAFLSVALTYWGVNCCLGGLHSYAS